jgi:hypothetical protein
MVSLTAPWLRSAVSQNSGMPLASASATSEILASSSSSSSSLSAALPASTSLSVGSASPAMMAARRS